MNKALRPLLAAALCATPALAYAQSTITDTEEHLLRGFFDRQTQNVAYAKLALTKGSTPQTRAFAQSELDFYTTLDQQVGAMDKEFCLVSNPMKAGQPPPELSQGFSRGVCNPAAGVTPMQPNIGAVVAGTATGPGGAPGGQGGAPGGPGGAPPGGSQGGPGGAAPGGASRGGPSGPNPNAGVNDTAMLQALSGRDFDKEYALRAIALHQRMESFCIREITTPGDNADLIAFANKVLVEINTQSDAALQIYTGETRRPRAAGGRSPG